MIQVGSAEEMQNAIMPIAPDQDVVVMAAAVADFRVVDPPAGKPKPFAKKPKPPSWPPIIWSSWSNGSTRNCRYKRNKWS